MIRIILSGMLIGSLVFLGIFHYKRSIGTTYNIENHLGYLSLNSTSEPEVYDSIVRLESQVGFCSGVVIDSKYALTASHCVTDGIFGTIASVPIAVYDKFGNYTEVIAYPLAADNSTDLAVIAGNFKSFKKAKVDFRGKSISRLNGMEVSACGFPQSGSLFCSSFSLSGNMFFQLMGSGGFGLPGSSGGPVFNSQQEVVGVISAVLLGNLLVAPVLNMDTSLHIRSPYEKYSD